MSRHWRAMAPRPADFLKYCLFAFCVLAVPVSQAARGGGGSLFQQTSPAGTGQTSSQLSKRGTGWGFTDPNVGTDTTVLAVAWWYNWGSDRGSAASLTDLEFSSEFVPMIYGNCCGLNTITSSIPADATALLGFNEPNHGEESNMTPQQAASLWPLFEQAKKQRGGQLRLGSPAPAPCGAKCVTTGNPVEWLDGFFAACNQMYGRDCEVDFIATHLYTCNAQYLQWYLNDMAARFKRPIWLTETACPNDGGALANQITYMRAALSVMDPMPSVERYAWFAPHAEAFSWLGGGQAGSPSLLQPGGPPPQLTDLGRIYMGLAAAGPAEGLSGDAAEAMRGPLPALSKAGSWSAACANCTGGASALASVAQQDLAAHSQRCLDCGFGASSMSMHRLQLRRPSDSTGAG